MQKKFEYFIKKKFFFKKFQKYFMENKFKKKKYEKNCL